ncbi:MAG: TonB-dependent receptor [Pyrinomonas methylaliphatogenes]|nr:TonB-dependent receptor [Pyrinomonas methylaliphatogenes]
MSLLRMRRTVAVLISSFLFSFPVTSQITEATLRGVVKDATGNAIASSVVAVQSEANGQVRTATTNEGGDFSLTGLAPGIYTVFVRVPGFKTFERRGLRLNVGQITDLEIRLEVGEVQATVQVDAAESAPQVSTEGRVADTFTQRQATELPLAQRDVFLLPKLSAGATAIPGAANSTKLTNSPVITVNGNRYRGNNYVLDGAMNTNPNNTGEPAIVPSLEAVEEVQVQTSNFSAEFGRGNGSVINIRTRSGTNEFHGRLWHYHRNAALNARNFFSTERAPRVFNQFGGNLGGPIIKNRTFFFASYEGTRDAIARALSFQVETPELRDYIIRQRPNSVAARLFRQFPAPTPLPGSGAKRYANQTDLTLDGVTIPATGTATINLRDYIRLDQYLARFDHSFNRDKDKLTARWIAEYQRDAGGTSSSTSMLGRAARGSRGPFDGFFGNLNLGHIHLFGRAVNDLRLSLQFIDALRGNDKAIVPEISITGITAPFGDVFSQRTKLRTYEVRDTLSFERSSHIIRAGGEARRIFKGLSIGPATAGTFSFASVSDFINDRPFRQTLTVDPRTGQPIGFPRYFTVHEFGLFVQDDWKASARLNINLGVRYDYFGDAREREGRLSSIIFGPGNSFRERLANASVGRVERLYKPERLNFSPRVGLAYDPFGDGRTSIRAGFSLAFQPHHGQSIAGARALPPDAVQIVSQPSVGIGTRILYDIPVPFNPEFARGLNPQGGINPLPGERARIRPTGFVVNPTIKTQYSESFFLSGQRQFGHGWIAEVGYVGTLGINLERIDDINRFRGDLLDGSEDRINPNFGTLLFVTNGVNSSYHGFTAEARRGFSSGLSVQVNYRFSKWLDTSSDTSTGQFQDNSEPGKGAQDVDCLRCERARSLFDIPHRFTASLIWTPRAFKGRGGWLAGLLNDWQVAALITAQSGRPFSVWNGSRQGDYNLDGGGGAVGGGFYDRPNAPLPGTIKKSFAQRDFLNGLFPASAFAAPRPGQNGTLGRNTFRGPRYRTLDLSLARSFEIAEERRLQIRFDVFNALNNVNLYLPNADLSLGNFGKSTQAFDARVLQAGLRLLF